MCGIAGIVGAREAVGFIAAMTSAQRHRGPDDEGFLLAGIEGNWVRAFRGPESAPGVDLPFLPDAPPEGANLAFGHRRLSILDLGPGGHGPMASPDEKLWVTYNGEIYNYVELRSELEGAGHRFRTGSDTEVLLAAYAQWGPAALDRFNGMFALALYDRQKRALFCARDRFGVKPFHYYWQGGLFAFASEIKGLLAHPSIPKAPYLPAAYAFLVDGALDETEQTFFKGILRLPAGHQLHFDLDSRRLEVSRWYALPQPGPRSASPADLRALVEDAVRLRLRSDVDVGTCLSGGLDSSSIVAITAKLRKGTGRNGAHRSFSVIYPDAGIDESRYVSAIVESTGVRGVATTPTAAELLEDLPDVVRHQDEPFASPGIYSQWRVFCLAREAGVKVLLDGQGADEVLAGYHYHFGPYLVETAVHESVAAAWRQARLAARVTERPLLFFLGLLLYHAVPLPRLLHELARARFATHGVLPRGDLDASAFFAAGHEPQVARHARRSTLYAERVANVSATSLPALLRYEDRNSMAFSIETRTPFLDYRLVELALRLPARALIRDGRTKAILREAVSGLIPETVRLRGDKLGFATPEKRWLEEMAPELRKWLGAGCRIEPLLRTRAQKPIDVHRPGLWRLVSLELWLRHLEQNAVSL